jgi:acetyl-CoA carboxylase carboxyl transferase subunit alpha
MITDPDIAAFSSRPLRENNHLELEKPLLRIEQDIAALRVEQEKTGRDVSAEIKQQQQRLLTKAKRIYSHLTAWETVLVARHPERPLVTDHIKNMVRDFCEVHGDRTFGDDRAIVSGFGRIGGHKVMVIGHNKGKDTRERIACNFGCAHPEGYRKAMLKMKLAAKFKLPVVCMIDTQGAFPGIGSEERGISQAIALNMLEMSRLRTPIVCVVIGEGGSGGALGIGVGDRVAVFENGFYSVISAEGCAAILWKTHEQRQRAAESLKFTAKDLRKLDLIDDIIPEPVGGAHRNPVGASASLEHYLIDTLRELKRPRIDTLVKRRYERFRHIGSYFDDPQERTDKKTRGASAPQSGTTRSKSRLAAAARSVRPSSV